MNKIPKFDKMDIKKKCLDNWEIPVINYDAKLLLSNKFNKLGENKNSFSSTDKFSNKPKTLKETAHLYSDYDKHSDSMQGLLDCFNTKSTHVIRIEEKLKNNNSMSELDEILNARDPNEKDLKSLLERKTKNNKKNTKGKNDKESRDKYSTYYPRKKYIFY